MPCVMRRMEHAYSLCTFCTFVVDILGDPTPAFRRRVHNDILGFWTEHRFPLIPSLLTSLSFQSDAKDHRMASFQAACKSPRMRVKMNENL